MLREPRSWRHAWELHLLVSLTLIVGVAVEFFNTGKKSRGPFDEALAQYHLGRQHHCDAVWKPGFDELDDAAVPDRSNVDEASVEADAVRLAAAALRQGTERLRPGRRCAG